MMYVIVAVISFILGGIFGVILMAVLNVASNDERMREKLDNSICKENMADHNNYM